MRMATLRAKYGALVPVFTERSRRVWAATEAQAIGYGGIALVARATGMAESTIQRGLRDLQVRHPLPPSRSRRAGGGRKRATVTDPTLLRDLDTLVEPTAPGDPESPLRWTSRSVRTLAVALDGLGHHVSHTVVAELLHALGYSLQGNAKTREGRQHPDRDAQFRYIAQIVRRWQRRRQPTISVDTKKKGAGRRLQEWRAGLAPGEDAPSGPRPRFRDPRHRDAGREGDSVRRLRSAAR
jgi:DDE family transposase